MTIKELQEAEMGLYSELTNLVSNILNNFYIKNDTTQSNTR